MHTDSGRKLHNIEVGSRGELLAAAYLRKKGYTIVERNFKVGRGEIDLIIRNDRVLAFVEVKTRQHGGYGLPEEKVDRRKQRQIGRIAQAYLQRRRIRSDLDCRFDVVAVDLITDEPEIRHIENAFWL